MVGHKLEFDMETPVQYRFMLRVAENPDRAGIVSFKFHTGLRLDFVEDIANHA